MAETTSGINQIPKPDGGFIYTATKVIQDGDGKSVSAQIIEYDDAKGAGATVIAEMSGTDNVPTFKEDASDNTETLENRNFILKVYRTQVDDAVKKLNVTKESKKTILDQLNNTNNKAGLNEEQTLTGVFTNVDVGPVIGDDEVNSSSELLRYPINQSSENYDFIKIQAFRYVPDFNIQRANTTTVREDGKVTQGKAYGVSLQGTGKRITETVGPQIFLPMTPSISETNNVGWGPDSLNPLQRRFGQAAIQSIDQASGGDFRGAIGTQIEAAQDLLQAEGTGAFIRAYFAGQAVGANLLGRAGIVVNPNLELLFNGPKLRSFKYDFTFTPRDPREASEIREIIKVFKKTMAVKRVKGNLFLKPPDIYKIKYVFNGGEFNDEKEHPFLNKIKPCALTSFNVNYAPDGSYMTYQNGSMTSYQVSMVFDELEPIYSDDQDSRTATSTMGF
jgi:hypothetical protein